MPTVTKADALSHKLHAGLTHELEAYHGPSFELRLWDHTGANYGSGLPRFTITVKSLNVLRALMWNPTELSLGDAFVRGDLEVEGDIFAMFEFADFVFFSGKHWAQSPSHARRIAIFALRAFRHLEFVVNDRFVHATGVTLSEQHRLRAATHLRRRPSAFNARSVSATTGS